MNPHLIEMLARQRAADLRRVARGPGRLGGPARAGAACPGSRQATRERVGWVLVEIGLRLATTSPTRDPGHVVGREFARG
jgi:hypothetical protein